MTPLDKVILCKLVSLNPVLEDIDEFMNLYLKVFGDASRSKKCMHKHFKILKRELYTMLWNGNTTKGYCILHWYNTRKMLIELVQKHC
jgi:hypothetical protein